MKPLFITFEITIHAEIRIGDLTKVRNDLQGKIRRGICDRFTKLFLDAGGIKPKRKKKSSSNKKKQPPGNTSGGNTSTDNIASNNNTSTTPATNTTTNHVSCNDENSNNMFTPTNDNLCGKIDNSYLRSNLTIDSHHEISQFPLETLVKLIAQAKDALSNPSELFDLFFPSLQSTLKLEILPKCIDAVGKDIAKMFDGNLKNNDTLSSLVLASKGQHNITLTNILTLKENISPRIVGYYFHLLSKWFKENLYNITNNNSNNTSYLPRVIYGSPDIILYLTEGDDISMKHLETKRVAYQKRKENMKRELNKNDSSIIIFPYQKKGHFWKICEVTIKTMHVVGDVLFNAVLSKCPQEDKDYLFKTLETFFDNGSFKSNDEGDKSNEEVDMSYEEKDDNIYDIFTRAESFTGLKLKSPDIVDVVTSVLAESWKYKHRESPN